jgi:hypothetical protein
VAAGGAAAVGALPHREGGGCHRGTLARRYRAPSGRRGVRCRAVPRRLLLTKP